MVTIVLLWVPILPPPVGFDKSTENVLFVSCDRIKVQEMISDGSARASYLLSIIRCGMYHDAIVIDRYKK